MLLVQGTPGCWPKRLPRPVPHRRDRRAIGHDYNHAQVLTLDLLAKGYRYRTSGRPFVRPLYYLRRVTPAIWRQLNPQPRPPPVMRIATPRSQGRQQTWSAAGAIVVFSLAADPAWRCNTSWPACRRLAIMAAG
jgi:hypothetical protein